MQPLRGKKESHGKGASATTGGEREEKRG